MRVGGSDTCEGDTALRMRRLALPASGLRYSVSAPDLEAMRLREGKLA